MVWFPNNYPECIKVLQIYTDDVDNMNDNLILPAGFGKKTKTGIWDSNIDCDTKNFKDHM